MEDISLDRALLYGIYQAGVDGYFKARFHGVAKEHLSDVDGEIFSLIEQFSRKGRLPTLVEIAVECPHAAFTPPTAEDLAFDVDFFAKKVADRELQTKLKDGLGPISRQYVTDPAAARTAMQRLVQDTAWSIGQVTHFNDPQVARELQEDYERAKNSTDGMLGLSSPWNSVDKYSKGLQPGELTVILAKRKTGKTWAMLAWVVHILKHDLKPGETVLIVSMEMARRPVYRRLAAIALRLSYGHFRGGRMTTEDEKSFYDWIDSVLNPADTSSPTIHVACADTIKNVDSIIDKCAELRPKLVALDGLYILKARDPKKGMWERTVENCETLKNDLAIPLNVPVLATTQFKGSKNKNDLNADADDAAYAKAIGDWADAMRGLFMNKDYERAKKRVFTAMESREFQGVDLKINFNLETMDFSEEKVLDDDEDAGDGGGGGDADTPLMPEEPPESLISGAGGAGEETVDY